MSYFNNDRYRPIILNMVKEGADPIRMYYFGWGTNRVMVTYHRANMLKHSWSVDDIWRLELAVFRNDLETAPIAVAVCLLARNAEEDPAKAAWWKCIVTWSYQRLLSRVNDLSKSD
eukprot:TRINITY_DN9439_c0_g1_i5.p1 TRINITY_DN9439_c0_g1~~TRINITY_DN9439_c0_g1_i5.p1  ORF type:complete len:116 (+),score=2.99 TRINITY_DN9439_c0_g1_i5:530-877(+)